MAVYNQLAVYNQPGPLVKSKLSWSRSESDRFQKVVRFHPGEQTEGAAAGWVGRKGGGGASAGSLERGFSEGKEHHQKSESTTRAGLSQTGTGRCFHFFCVACLPAFRATGGRAEAGLR